MTHRRQSGPSVGLSARITPDAKARLEQLAAEAGLSCSAVLERLILGAQASEPPGPVPASKYGVRLSDGRWLAFYVRRSDAETYAQRLAEKGYPATVVPC